MWFVLKLQNTPKKEIRWTWIQSWTHKKQTSESSKPLLHVTIHACLCWPFQSENCPWSPLNNVYQLYMYVVQYLDIHGYTCTFSKDKYTCDCLSHNVVTMLVDRDVWTAYCFSFLGHEGDCVIASPINCCAQLWLFFLAVYHTFLCWAFLSICKLVISSVLLPIYLTLSVSQ